MYGRRRHRSVVLYVIGGAFVTDVVVNTFVTGVVSGVFSKGVVVNVPFIGVVSGVYISGVILGALSNSVVLGVSIAGVVLGVLSTGFYNDIYVISTIQPTSMVALALKSGVIYGVITFFNFDIGKSGGVYG